MNPADHASRDLSPKSLLKCRLWRYGPEWLVLPPDSWPRRPDINLDREIPEMRSTVLIIKQPQDKSFWDQFVTFDTLLRAEAWTRRLLPNSNSVRPARLTSDELDIAKLQALSEDNLS